MEEDKRDDQLVGGSTVASDIDTRLAYQKKSELEGEGYEVAIFPSISDVLRAVSDRSTIDSTILKDVNLIEKIRNPSFRFVTFDHVELSVAISTAFAEYNKYTVEELENDISSRDKAEGWFVPANAIEKSIATRQKKADAFALTTFEQVEQIKREENVTSYRKTVEALNRRGIPTPTQKDGTWRLSTLQSLYNRFEGLRKKDELER